MSPVSLAGWLELEDLGDGRVRMPMTVRTRNQVGDLHGGALAALAEAASHRTVPSAVACTPGLCAMAININYLRPSVTTWVTARAGLIWAGETSCACTVEVMDEARKATCRALIQYGVVPSETGVAGTAVGRPTEGQDRDAGPGEIYDRATADSYRTRLGIRTLLQEPGLVELLLPGAPHWAEADGVLSLGLMAGLIDLGGGQSLLGNLPPHWTATINLQVHLLRRVPPQDLITRMEAVQLGRTIGVTEGTVFAGGSPAAAGMATFIMKRD